MLHKGANLDATILPTAEVLKMATVNGAKALGRKAGVLAAGWDADLLALDFDQPHLKPCHDVMENLVYSAHGSDVVMNMARGKVIYENGSFLTLDLKDIRARLKDYALPRIFGCQPPNAPDPRRKERYPWPNVTRPPSGWPKRRSRTASSAARRS